MQGFLLLDKPKNITSYRAVAMIKRIAGEKRVGHTGTLDPLATGVLPVLIGRATALSSYLLDGDKSYTAHIKLGVKTDSCDITGNITEENPVNVSDGDIERAIDGFIGKQLQTPPMFSAIKKDGVRLYTLARRGETVEVPKREITVYSLKKTSALDSENVFSFEATVSKGTYIRSLARDLGEALGCGAVLTELRRTSASGFSVEECVSPEELTPENIALFVKSEEKAVAHFKRISVTGPQAVRFCNGGYLYLDRVGICSASDGELFRVCSGDNFLGLGNIDLENNRMSVKCVIRDIRCL